MFEVSHSALFETSLHANNTTVGVDSGYRKIDISNLTQNFNVMTSWQCSASKDVMSIFLQAYPMSFDVNRTLSAVESFAPDE